MQARPGRDWRAAPAALVVLALWLFTHPWAGLWHDGRLYAVQALNRLYPGHYSQDLFFRFGSQDAFTLFTPAYAALIAAVGLDSAALLVQAAGSVLWLAGAACLLSRFLRGLQFWIGLACLFALPTDYGPSPGIFSLAESFPTPRLFAEALSMLAVACVLRGRWLWGVPALLLAGLLHPLVALWAGLFGLLYLAEGGARARAIVLLLAAGGAALALGAALGVAPFDRLLLAVDAPWYAVLESMTPAVAWDGWRLGEWGSRTALAFSLVLAAAWLEQGWRARFYWCVALTGAIGLLACWVGTGLLHNALLMQVQPWRALWLLQAASWLALVTLLARYWQGARILRLLLLALCVAILTRNTIGGLLGIAAALGLCLQARRSQPLLLQERHYRMALAGLAVAACFYLREVAGGPHWTYIYINDIQGASMGNLWFWILLKRGGAALAAAAVLLLAWRWAGSARRSRVAAAWLLALGCLGACAALLVTRAETAVPMAPQSQQALRAAFQPLVPAGSVVYWQDDVRYTWFVLQRASYASLPQMGGAVFNRGSALEGQRRLARLAQLGTEDSVRGRSRAQTDLLRSRLPKPQRAGLLHLCADPLLDFVVLERDLGEGAVARHQDRLDGRTFHLYACARLR